MSPEELNSLRMTIESILFPESKPFSVDQEARDVRRGKRAREFPHCVHCGSDAISGHGTFKHYRRYLKSTVRRLLPISPRPALRTSKSMISSASISSLWFMEWFYFSFSLCKYYWYGIVKCFSNEINIRRISIWYFLGAFKCWSNNKFCTNYNFLYFSSTILC